ncbi:polyprenol phosphomannose-dependent alpha 1,6 mannosyltransferase MptB [Kocuria sp. cx-455]|uniref:polyprenol phosphomannose-dependent alpha 1,6 mannosyltransferase MptB n=1 Tax=Kocuria sp. cx-455 TaxID=2771377 RepID=UPI001682D070|nr:polyprenol phosphomannose-dependent alpha 1,6 mannosyltransferase MptB [Kocuria sp. cx-455]MBD2765298.1 polyprenol phosphomannose-dependent alpha 1,6 mannosyltransferase MptB [Kocuria sp. cx-455]
MSESGSPPELTAHGSTPATPRADGEPLPAEARSVPGTPRVPRPLIAIVQGLIGSLMMFVGSIGIGWIALGSPMVRNPLVIAMRTEGWGIVISTVLLTFGAMLLMRSWVRLGQRLTGWPKGSLRAVVIAVLAWSLPLLLAVPIFSRDVYAYIGQGRLMEAGENPYTTGISTLDNWFMLGADPAWAESRTPYGPVFLWLAHLVVEVTGAQPDLSVLLFRLLSCAGVALCVLYVPKLAAMHGFDGARALWLTVANPLFLISFVASAHNDGLMVGLAVAGTYFAATGRPIRGILLVTASIGIKPITILLLPFIGLLWAGTNASWPRKFATWAGTAILSFGLLLLSGIPYDLGPGWILAILDPTPGYTGYSPSGFLSMQVNRIGDALGLPGGDIAATLRNILKYLGIGIVVLLMFWGEGQRSHRVVRRMGLAFAAVVMLSPIIQPWYILWFLPFLAVTGIKDNWQVRVLYVVTGFFVIFGAQDQLSVWPYIEVSFDVSTIAYVVALAFTGYLMFLDPHTKHVLIEGGPRGWLDRRRRRRVR